MVISTTRQIYWSSTTVMSAMGSTVAYPIVQECHGVDLSTKTGATCPCGKLSISIAALPIKTLTLDEVRQVVASGFKLAHGITLQSIRWDVGAKER